MTRLTALDPGQAPGQAKELFTAIESKLGMVPNMMRTMGQSPALLGGYLNFSAALGEGRLGAKLGTLIALTVAESNRCGYCLAAHTYIGKNLNGLTSEKLEAARRHRGTDSKTEAALTFAHQLVNKKGNISDADLAQVREAGFSEGEVAEIVGHVALNIFTNYFNLAAATEVDFPVVETYETAVV